MVEQHRDHSRRVTRFDWQHGNFVAEHIGVPELLEGSIEPIFTQADLDGDLTIARRTEENLVAVTFDRLPSRLTELRIIQNEPKEGMRIEEQLQGT